MRHCFLHLLGLHKSDETESSESQSKNMEILSYKKEDIEQSESRETVAIEKLDREHKEDLGSKSKATTSAREGGLLC